jgi:hypothetical protein
VEQWIGAAIGPRKYRFTRREGEGRVRQWHGNNLDLKTHVACGPCNHGWMSELESRSKPILRDMILHCSETTLRDPQIAVVAAVAFKNAVVADYMHDNRPPIFTTSGKTDIRPYAYDC